MKLPACRNGSWRANRVASKSVTAPYAAAHRSGSTLFAAATAAGSNVPHKYRRLARWPHPRPRHAAQSTIINEGHDPQLPYQLSIYCIRDSSGSEQLLNHLPINLANSASNVSVTNSWSFDFAGVRIITSVRL